MRRILFSIGSLTVYSYGFMVAMAVLLGLIWVGKAVKKKRLGTYDNVVDITVWLFIGGLIGARIFYIIVEFPYYFQNPAAVFRLTDGGLSFFGMLFGAYVLGLWYMKKAKLPTWKIADVIAVYLPLGYALARVGCLLNGCCYGVPSDLPWAFAIPTVDNLPRHPTQIYAILISLITFVIIWLLRNHRHFPGFLFWLYVLLYTVGRFIVEAFRESQILAFGWLRFTQFFCLLVIIAVGIYLCYRLKNETKTQNHVATDITS